ncbi:MAG: hypothetical protein JJU35_13350, partial [Balneolales bacterium]|nr:hypothetical protein [Balneolales bacterium]
MKTKLLLLATAFVLLFWEVTHAQFSGGTGRGDDRHSFLIAPPSNFFLAENGLTVTCPDAQID